MNVAGDYSAAYCILNTDSEHSGHGMFRNPAPPEKKYSNWSHHIKTFTIGRGNDIVCSAIIYLAARIKGSTLASLVKD
jgi:L-galactonate dehydratase